MTVRAHTIADLPYDIRMEAESLAPGEQVTGLLCPMCEGGRSQERSLDIRHTGAWLGVKCWRAGCGYYRKIPQGGPFVLAEGTFTPMPYRYALCPLSLNQRREVADRWHLSGPAIAYGGIQLACDEVEPSLWLPVWSPQGAERGGVLRRLEKPKYGPKALTYRAVDEPWLAWYRAATQGPLVIVEDQISALRVWQIGLPAVSLMGTHLSPEMVEEIDGHRRDREVLLALDADAFSVAVRACRRYGDILPIRPVLLGKDLKDLPDDAAVREVLSQ